MIPLTVIRHPKERLSKCSLNPIKERENIQFHKASEGFFFDATGYILLHLDAPVLSAADAGNPLLILDSTWRLLPALEGCITGEPIRRSLPAGTQTAYPRVSKIAEDPMGGLASIEAVYLACKLLGEDDPTLLEGYRWKEAFLEQFSDQ